MAVLTLDLMDGMAPQITLGLKQSSLLSFSYHNFLFQSLVHKYVLI